MALDLSNFIGNLPDQSSGKGESRPSSDAGQSAGGNIESMLRSKADEYGIDPDLFVGLARRESGLNPGAKNPGSSAGGLFQFLDGTWRGYGKGDKFDPEANADAAARMFKENLNRFGGDPRLALAAHHVGPGKAEQALRDAKVGDKDVSTQKWLSDIYKLSGIPEEKKGGSGAFVSNAEPEVSSYEPVRQQMARQAVSDESPISTSLKRGWNSMTDSVGNAIDAAAGNSEGVAKRLEKAREFDRETPAPTANKQWEQDWQDSNTSGWLGNISGFVGNSAEQLANSVPSMVGSIPGAMAGGSIGSAFGPVGLLVGGVIGGFVGSVPGSVATETGSRIPEMMGKDGVNMNDPAAVRDWMTENRDKVLHEGVVKGLTTASFDGITGGIGQRIIAGPMLKFARHDVATLTKMGVDTADKTALAAARSTVTYKTAMQAPAAELKAATTVAQNAMRGSYAFAGEMIGEGGGEYYGEKMATGQGNLDEALKEALFAGGQSAATTAASFGYRSLIGADSDKKNIDALAAFNPPAAPPQVIKSNSPLSNAANSVLNPEGVAAQRDHEAKTAAEDRQRSAASQIDPDKGLVTTGEGATQYGQPFIDDYTLTHKFDAIKAFISQPENIRALRKMDPEMVGEALHVWNAVINNPDVNATNRKRALEQMYSMAQNLPNFTMQEPPAAQQPGLLGAPEQQTGVQPAQQQGGDVGQLDLSLGSIPGESTRIAGELPAGTAALAEPVRQISAPVAEQAPSEALPATQTAAPDTEAPLQAAKAEMQKRFRFDQLKDLVGKGFDKIVDGHLVNSKTGHREPIAGPAEMLVARNAIRAKIDQAAHAAATSPQNDKAEPTQAQADAGKYAKGHIVNFHGFNISIENPNGSIRRGVSPDGVKWESLMHGHYGYFKGIIGYDKDHLDINIGPRPDLDTFYVIDQRDPKSGHFDEHKVYAGQRSIVDANKAYHSNYEAGWEGMQDITPLSLAEFKEWVADGGPKQGPVTLWVDARNEAAKPDFEPANQNQIKNADLPGAETVTAPEQSESSPDAPLSEDELSAMFDDAAAELEADKATEEAEKPAAGEALPNATAPEHVSTGVDDRELDQIVEEFNAAQQSMIGDDGDKVTHVFDAPAKGDVVRLADKVRVYHAKHGWMTPEIARAKINEWKEHARSQYDNKDMRTANSQRVVLSLFDLSGKWSQPWEEAGYQVYRFDIQDDPQVGDVNNFSTEFFNDWFGDFDGMDIYAILAATPCTDFASSGARHFAAKDKDGRTVASVNLVHQTLRTIEYFKPAVWALENPVGRIEKLGGLPPWRLSFDPNHVGEDYTKKTLIWGRFDGNMPIAPTEPTEGSKMHRLYGGKSMATKNARSETPEGFAYSFFMANNAVDNPVLAVAGKYDRLDRDLIKKALDAGVTADEIDNAVEDFYYMDLDDKAANEAIAALIPEGTAPKGWRKSYGTASKFAESLGVALRGADGKMKKLAPLVADIEAKLAGGKSAQNTPDSANTDAQNDADSAKTLSADEQSAPAVADDSGLNYEQFITKMKEIGIVNFDGINFRLEGVRSSLGNYVINITSPEFNSVIGPSNDKDTMARDAAGKAFDWRKQAAAKKTEAPAAPETSGLTAEAWDSMGYGGRQDIAQTSNIAGMRAVVHRIAGSSWAELSDGERQSMIEAHSKKATPTAEPENETEAPARPERKLSVKTRFYAGKDAGGSMIAVLVPKFKDVKIAGLEGRQFFIHENSDGIYVVTERSTGLAFARGVSEAGAIKAAGDIVAQHTAANIEKVIAAQPAITEGMKKAALAKDEQARKDQEVADQQAAEAAAVQKQQQDEREQSRQDDVARRSMEKELFAELQGNAILRNTAGVDADNFRIEAVRQVTQWIGDQMSQAAVAEDIERVKALNLMLKDNKPTLPAEFYDSLLADAQKKKKQIQQDDVKDAARQAGSEAFSRSGLQDDQREAFDAGWAHALDGKTKSTLPSDAPSAKGYEAAVEWGSTPEGRAAMTGKRSKKLSNTGADLRRWYEQQRKKIGDASDTDSVIAALELATNRGDLLRNALSENATPGAGRWFDMLRNSIKPFKAWLDDGELRNVYGAYVRGRGKYDEKLRLYIDGQRYLGDNREESRADRIERLQKAADKYMNQVQSIAEAIDNAQTVSQAASRLYGLIYTKTDRVREQYQNASRYHPREWTDFAKSLSSVFSDGPKSAMRLSLFPSPIAMEEQSSYLRDLLSKEDDTMESSRKASLLPPKLDQVERDGDDYREGANVTPEFAKQKFNFADIGFGKWVGGKRDQDHLNYAYDAFLDLAKLLNLPPEAVSIGGRLHFTVGALGHGKFAAHYTAAQPHPNGTTVPVINVTNTRGDGTLGHEWAHALDLTPQSASPEVQALKLAIGEIRADLKTSYNFDQVKNGVIRMLKGESWFTRGGGGKNKTKTESGRLENAQQAVDYYAANSRQQSNYMKEAVKLDGAKANKDPYWSNDWELFARAFEAWSLDALPGNSTYLVNPLWAGEGMITEKTHRGTPYPMNEERERFAEWFDALSKSMVYNPETKTLGVDNAKWQENKPTFRKDWEDALAELKATLPALMDQLAAEKEAAELDAESRKLHSMEMKVGDLVIGRDIGTYATKYPEPIRIVVTEKDRDAGVVIIELADGKRHYANNFEITLRKSDADLQALAKAKAEQEQAAPASEPTGDLNADDLERIFDEAAAELEESTAEQPAVEAPGTAVDKLADGWTVEDIDFLRKQIQDGRKILLASDAPGLPTIHDMKGADHIGFGTFKLSNPNYTLTFDGGGAMGRTPSGQAYTVISFTRGEKEFSELVYNKDAMLAKLDAFVGGKQESAPQQGEAPAPNLPTLDDNAAKSAAATIAAAAKLGIHGLDETFKGLAKIFGGGPGKLSSFPGGLDEASYQEAKPHFIKAMKHFQAMGSTLKEFFKILIATYGMGVKPYAIRFAKEMNLSASMGAKPSAVRQVANFVADNMRNATSFTSRALFDKADAAFEGTQAEGKYSPKDAYDAMEAGVNLWIRNADLPLTVGAEEAAANAAKLKSAIAILPTQTRRDAEMDEYQQFSTPPALSYVSNWVANVKPGETMMEPSAGTGDLAIWAEKAGADLILNELASRRVSVLRDLFPSARIFTENAEQLNNILPRDAVPTVVVMNPPFSSTAGRIQGQRDTMNGGKHIEQALKRLAPGGRLVAIVGEGMAADRPAFKQWWTSISKDYNVRANIGISGKEYAKYGTTFDNQILVIDKTGPTTGQILTGKVESPTELPALLEGIRNDRQYEASSNPPSEPDADQPGGGGLPPQDGLGDESERPDGDTTGDLGSGKRGDGAGDGQSGGAADGSGKSTRAGKARGNGGRSGGSGGRGKSTRSGSRDSGNADGQSGSNDGRVDTQGAEDSGVTLGADAAPQENGELTDSVYENYRPQRLSIAGAKDHPGKLVQSAAMSSVEPPAPTYTPNLPKAVITDGLLSLPQIEAVVYAGQAHSQMLPGDKFRRGFFIGDGTGTGKGREISGIIMDNMRQGRTKAVWVSFGKGLIKDAKRDFKGIGGDPTLIHWHGKTKTSAPITMKSGVLFTTYSTLRGGEDAKANGAGQDEGQTRVDQIVKWLGEDFDGVIMFDEAHGMSNSIEMKGKRGKKKPSKQALAGIDLQLKLPNARIVYVSATGATEVSNLTYANRLGLWGEATPFADARTFIQNIEAGGVAAMELISRDMKAMGMYISRALSFDGVTYERLDHELTPLQIDIYNELAKSWQLVLNNINQALEITGQNKDGKAKSAAMSRFWSTHQRFFNQIITSMQTPSVIEDMHKQIEAGNAILIQLNNTNEAEQERQAAKAAADEVPLEELDFTPRQALMDMVRNGFPVQKYEEQTDDDGNSIMVSVKDSNGNPVFDSDAVALREQLLQNLENIRVPENPIDAIINAFGTDTVAEVTGRGRRFVQKRDENGNLTVVEEKRGANSSEKDADEFQSDKKKILIFSQAGGTGYSFHSDLTAINQRRRVHYMLQPGWQASATIQGVGRSHRTNQASEPHYVLPTTNLKAQKRFISSIARRLDQLGALTRGQRQASGGGMFAASDNLENQYAKDALEAFFMDLYNGKTPLNFHETTHAMGIDNLLDSKTGALNTSNLPEIPRFLNRLLSLQSHEQDAVFGEFEKRLTEIVEFAINNGTYDTGLENLKAASVVKTRDEVAYTDQRTGAQTRYVEIDVTNPVKYRSWETADIWGQSYGEKFAGWFKDEKGVVFGLANLGSRVDASGNISNRGVKYTIRDGRNDYIENADAIIRRGFTVDKTGKKRVYTTLKPSEAQAAWELQVAAAPKNETKRERLIVGIILPVWDRIKGHPRIVRVQTDSGERMIGRVLGAKDAEATLKNLGLGSTVSKMQPSELLARIMGGSRAILGNSWEISQSLVSGEKRIEIKPPSTYFSHGDRSVLESQGVFFERIQWKDRAFIPQGENAMTVFGRVIAAKPIVEIYGGSEEEAPAVLSRGLSGNNPAPVAGLINVPTAKATIARLTATLVTAPDTSVVQNFNELPAEVQEQARNQDADERNTKGMFHNGTLYVVAGNHSTMEDLEQTVFHELYGHFGMRQLLGPNFIQKMNGIFASMGGIEGMSLIAQKAGFGPQYAEYIRGLAGARQENPALYTDKIVKFVLAEEIFAHIAEDNGTLKQKLREFIGMVRDWLRSHGFAELAKMNDADVAHLLSRAKKNLEGPNGGGPRGGVALPDSDAPSVMRRSISADAPEFVSKIRQSISDAFQTQKTFNWWHKSVGTQFHKSTVDADFGKVYNLAQKFIDDTSRYANEAADMAPDLLPKLETMVDVVTNTVQLKKAERDAKAIAGPVFIGTLNDRVFTDDELRFPPDNGFGEPQFAALTDEQIILYRQFRAAIDHSLDSLAMAEMKRLGRASNLQMAPEGLTLRQTALFYQEQYGGELDALREQQAEMKQAQTSERALLEDAANDEASSAEERKRYAKLLMGMVDRHKSENEALDKKIKALAELEKGIIGKMEAIEKLKTDGYAPLTRFGQYTVDVFLADDDGKPLKNGDGEDIRPFFGMFESEKEANEVARALQEEYPSHTVTQGIMSQDAFSLFQGVTPETMEAFAKMMGVAQDEAFQQYLKLSVSNRSAMKKLIHRKKIAGFSDDPTRVLAAFITSNARAASQAENMSAMMKAATDIPKSKGDVQDEAVKLIGYLQNPGEEASKLRGLMFINYLGGSIASAMVNLTQTITMTLPYLHQFAGSDTLKKLAGASAMASKRMMNKDFQVTDPSLRAALQKAAEEGVTSPHEIHMLYGESMQSGVFQNNRYFRNFTKLWGSFFSLAERFNRDSTFIAAYQIAQDRGLTGDAAYEFASEAVAQTQGVYSKANRPNWARGAVGATLFTFKQYSISYLEFLKRLPPKERAIAVGILILAAGLQGGIPGADDMDDVLDTIMESLGYAWQTKKEKRDFLANAFGADAANFMLYGVSALMPLDIAGRMSIGNVIPGTGLLKRSETDKTRDVKEFFGPVAGLADQAVKGFEKLQGGSLTDLGTYAGIGQELMPKALRDLSKGYDMMTTGVYHDTKGRRVVDVSPLEAVIKSIGFQPESVAQDSRARQIVAQDSALAKAVQGEIQTLWAEGIYERDQGKIQRAMEARNEWNQKNPEARIEPKFSSIQSKVRMMRLSADERMVKSAPPAMRAEATRTVYNNQ